MRHDPLRELERYCAAVAEAFMEDRISAARMEELMDRAVWLVSRPPLIPQGGRRHPDSRPSNQRFLVLLSRVQPHSDAVGGIE